jgi:hypothetical protein
MASGMVVPQLQNGLLEQQVEDIPYATWIAMYFQHDGVSLSLFLTCDVTSQCHFP